MQGRRFYVLGPLMGGYGSKAFLGQELSPSGRLRPAVLIFLAEELVEDQELFERICQETKVAVRLDHLNIITILGLVKLEDGYARITEFADGESLRSVFARARELRRKIPEPIAAAVIADACAGVHHAHEAGVKESGRPMVHEAVRPGTILVTFRGIGMVTGYGTAAIVEGMLGVQGTNVAIQDHYTAPELIAKGPEAASVQSDVYGLGVVLFEALSGKPPDEFPETPDEGIFGVAQKAMALEAADRFPSAIEMRKALLREIEVAAKHDVAAFMQEIFPNDHPQIQARRIMLKRGQLEYDTDPPELTGDGPPETVDLVWRYPIREVAKPVTEPPKQKPVLVPPEPKSAPAPAPEPAPEPTRRLPPEPPPPMDERKSRRIPPFVYLGFILLVAAAFVIGLMFSDWGREKTPEPQHVPVVLKPLDQEPPPVKKPTPTEPAPKVKKVKKPKRAAKRRKLAVRASGAGYLNVKAPKGSKVYIRDRYVGSAPLKRLKLPPGKHKVVVVKEETGQKYKRMVPIRPGHEMTLTVDFY
ncbi:protein kinase [Myxococcota bacterium]